MDGSKIECKTFTEGFVADAKDCIHGDRLQGAEFQIHSKANILLCAAHAKRHAESTDPNLYICKLDRNDHDASATKNV